MAGAAYPMQVNVTASKTNPEVGESFYVTVSGVDMPKNDGASLGLVWNSAVVSVTGIALAPRSPFDFLTSNAPANSAFTFAKNEGNVCEQGPCSFDAVRINFKVIGKGKANIIIKDDGASLGWSNPDDPNFGMFPTMDYNQTTVVVGPFSGDTAAPAEPTVALPEKAAPAAEPAAVPDKATKDSSSRDRVIVSAVVFAVLAVIFMFAGRKLGSMLSEIVRYPAPAVVAMVFAVGWGVLVALAIRELLNWQQPVALVGWLFGYGLGGYVAVPNYNVLKPMTFPEPAKGRHIVSAVVSLIIYVGASALFALVLSND